MSVCRIAVCEDVEIEREMLCRLLQGCGGHKMIYSFSCGEDLLNSHVAFDLVILDIFMKGMTGMDVAKVFHEKNHGVPIVFVTSSAEYALESYDVQAFDYIVKPLRPERLNRVWERFLSYYKQNQKVFVLNCSGVTKRLPYESIEYVESDCHYVTFHMADGSEIRLNGRLDDVEQQLDDLRFLRCHKSFLINLNLVQTMDMDFVMKSGSHVAYRKRDRKQIQQLFREYLQDYA